MRRALIVLTLAALVMPTPVLAARGATEGGTQAAERSFDTPEPTPRRTPRPERTPRPGRTADPEATPQAAPRATAPAPARNAITVGYREPGILGQAPLLVALLAGYFREAGFEDVRIVEVRDTLTDVREGQLDFGVVDARDGAALTTEDSTLRAVAGYRNLGPDGTYGGDLLLAAPGLVADEPATVIAFLVAYIRALQDLSDPETADDALALIEDTDLSLDPELAAGWPEAVGVFAPFDGGFGSLDVEGGLGELEMHLEGADSLPVDFSYFIAQHTLNIAQASLGLAANPATDMTAAPGLPDVSVGVAGGDEAGGPIAVARAAGYFEAAGFSAVEVMDVEEPLLGVLTGELQFGIVDAVTAADGVAQGLPLLALAGHRNYAADGTYGGDLLVASADLLDEEASTVAAFLIAYIRGLQDLRESPEATLHAPHDGGFGERALDGGLAELREHLAAALGEGQDPEALIAAQPLELAQAWWGLPANPIRSPVPSVDASADEPATEEDAG